MSEPHFLQTKYWADVRAQLGHIPVWVGESLLLIKPLPKPLKAFGYMPQVQLVHLDWAELVKIAAEYDLSHIQLDPDDLKGKYSLPDQVISRFNISPAEAIYYRDTLVLDLTKTEEELMSEMHKKHRYNIRVAQKHGVRVRISDSNADFEVFEKLFFDTVARQNYFGRSPAYYQTIWKTLQPEGRVRIATASYKGQPLVSWMLFLGDKTIYYPYGGSSDQHRNVMAANGLVWGIVEWGKKFGYTKLDLWGIDPQTGDSGQNQHGFSDFKVKFGGEQLHYLPSYDLVLNSPFYSIFKLGNAVRWGLLKLKRLFKK